MTRSLDKQSGRRQIATADFLDERRRSSPLLGLASSPSRRGSHRAEKIESLMRGEKIYLDTKTPRSGPGMVLAQE
jgi:hypothetical protein